MRKCKPKEVNTICLANSLLSQKSLSLKSLILGPESGPQYLALPSPS